MPAIRFASPPSSTAPLTSLAFEYVSGTQAASSGAARDGPAPARSARAHRPACATGKKSGGNFHMRVSSLQERTSRFSGRRLAYLCRQGARELQERDHYARVTI